MSQIPDPTPEAIAHSQQLISYIQEQIAANGNKISFARFMELVLYAPGLGYYSAGSRKFGASGDFVTAPEISPLFAKSLANQCLQVLTIIENGSVLEFGAGTGILAVDLLLALEKNNSLPKNYFILEISADLKQRQKEFIQKKIPHLFERCVWLTEIPKDFIGVIIANEVLDAMPVHRFRKSVNNEIGEFYVTFEDGHFAWKIAEPSSVELKKKIQDLPIKIAGTHYDSEVNLIIPAWIKSLSTCLVRGLVLLVDYGFPQPEYYHPDRTMGTLMCHYRHLTHPDPLCFPGLQDITAHIDFTAVAEAAVLNDLHVAGFTSQAAFLLSCGLLNLADSEVKVCEQLKISQQIQLLTSPAEMGELFKVMALTRGVDELNLLGFSMQDRRVML